MGNPKGFLTYKRKESGYRPVEKRLNDFSEVEQNLSDTDRIHQAARCMDCGVPFCHWACPVGNIMPEWHDLIFRGDWKGAYENLIETNNFPEFTGRVCPALCEAACVLAIDDSPVTIRENELSVIERAFEEGYVIPHPPANRTGKKVAVVGGGPAGLAAADILNQAGHNVVIFEADNCVGGYLRYGIPDFKLDKDVIDRRVNILVEEGIDIRTGLNVGKDVSISDLKKEYDAVCLTIGAREPRDLSVENRDSEGIYFALDYLIQQNKILRGDKIPEDKLINALNKSVVVVGGGDTGSDCVGTANRQGASSVTQIELMPKLPDQRTENEPWPLWPRLYKTSSSQEEGCERKWNLLTKKFKSEYGLVKSLVCTEVDWSTDESGKYNMKEIPGSEITLKADLVLIAMGFVHAVHKGLVSDLGLNLDERGNILIDDNYMTSVDGVFAAGDSSRGASLIVWAIHDGRKAAEAIDAFLNE